MLKKYSAIFSRIMVELFDAEACFYMTEEKDVVSKALDQAALDRLQKYILVMCRNMSDELGLDSVPPLLDRIEYRLKTPDSYLCKDAHGEMSDLRSRIEDHLRNRLFFFIAPGKVAYYENKQLFGKEVADRFPNAIDDIEGAGKCLAFGQGTATVLHLMRVMEVGLKALAKPLGIPYAPSWESYLTQIQSKIAARHNTKSRKWKKQEPFFRDVSGDLISIKQAWRNPTMHVVRKYSTDEAEEIFRAVRTLMQHIANNLPTGSSSAVRPP